MPETEVTTGGESTPALDGSPNFKSDFKSQLLCKRTRDGLDQFSTTALIENAAMAVGGFFLGKKFLAPKVPFAGFFTKNRRVSN